jgi:predicted MPP superfamily phosphohydrolase
MTHSLVNHSISIMAVVWVLLVFFLFYKKLWKTAILVWSMVFLWVRMRFVEPYMITLEYATIDLWISERIALVGDMHLWVYKGEKYLQRVVDRINTLEIDRVLIAWDFLNHPTTEQTFETLFAPLWDLQVPWYTVMGNHDVLSPYAEWEAELATVLNDLWWEVIDNRTVVFDDWTLVGLGSHMAWDDDLTILDAIDDTFPLVVLAHNPDSTLAFPIWKADLTLVGHTHCGQVRIPWLYEHYRRFIIPTVGDFDCWYTVEESTQLFITPWLGEVILPIRLMNPVTISILTL